MKHYGRVYHGKLKCGSFRKAVDALVAKGAVELVLTVEEFKPKRGTQANRYYRGVVIELMSKALMESGWEPRECTPDAVHELMKARFLCTEKQLPDGSIIERVRSTTELDSNEFAEFVDHVIRFAAEYLNVVIPAPGEQMELV